MASGLNVHSDEASSEYSSPRETSKGSQSQKVMRDAIVVFKVNVAETCAGESIKVVGSHPALGSWNASKGVPLTTDSYIYPSWRATVLLSPPEDCHGTFNVEYKYVRDRRALDMEPGMEFLWEETAEKRGIVISIDKPFKEHVVQDDYLGEISFKLNPVLSARGHKHRPHADCHPQIDCTGDVIDKYDLTECTPVAVGASAKIFRCEARTSRAPFAVKLIDRNGLRKEEKRNLFGIRSRQGEIELHAQLKHPNVVRLVEVFVTPNYVALVMEACNGGDLHDCIKKQRNSCGYGFSELVVAAVLQQMLKALEYLHTGGICHRDVKSENVLVLENDVALENCTIKLGDFGFAACLQQVKGGSLRTLLGSPNYVAPEVIRGHPYATSVDVWSAGVVMHHLLVGVLPFRAPTSRGTLKKVQIGIVNTETSAWTHIGDNAKDFLHRLLRYEVPMRVRAKQALCHNFLSVVGSPREKSMLESVSSMGRAESTMYASDDKDTDSLCDTETGAPIQAAHDPDTEQCFPLNEGSDSECVRRNDVGSGQEETLEEYDSSSTSEDDEDENYDIGLEPFIYARRKYGGDGDEDEKPRACFAASSASGMTTFQTMMGYMTGKG